MNANIKNTIADKFRNTSLGFVKIKNNLSINHFTDNETENLLRNIILSTPLQDIVTKGKNYYFKCLEHNAILTVNSYTFTIITAKKINKKNLFFEE